MSLRLPADLLNMVDRVIGSHRDGSSRNNWITKAIQEKLVREEQSPYGSPSLLAPLPFLEFFAGGGMARLGLGSDWICTLANDFDKKKSAAYRINWGGDELLNQDVGTLTPDRIPGSPKLAWASFPCQDLSLAGAGAGLAGRKSGTFWSFWNLIKQLRRQSRAPNIIVLENVVGAITSDGGRDFESLLQALSSEGYVFGPLVMDAALFLPQSRPRLFIVAVRDDGCDMQGLVSPGPTTPFHNDALEEAFDRAPAQLRKKWYWWHLPAPDRRTSVLSDIIEEKPSGVEWNSAADTKRLIQMMSPVNRRKIDAALSSNTRQVGTLYRRTRNGEQRAEVRFDSTAGCLRTPGGGSSRQTLLIVEAGTIRSRLLSPREAARLMGLPDSYKLPTRYNDAYHLAGDGLVVPVVAHLSKHLLTPLARRTSLKNHAAA